MDEQKVKLPGFLVADLYKDVLVEIADESPGSFATKHLLTADSGPVSTIQYLGENLQKVIVVVTDEHHTFLAEGELDLLSKILKACGLNLSDVAIVNHAQQQVSYMVLKKELDARRLLLFGVTTVNVQLPFSLPLFQTHNFDGLQMIASPALLTLNENKPESTELKKQLWAALKKW